LRYFKVYYKKRRPMIIKAANNLTTGAPKTYTSGSMASAVTVVPWKNSAAFTASWAIQLGETKEEQSEIRVLGTSTPAGTAGTVTEATSFSHPADTPVYAVKFDKVIFKCATAGTAGTATAITDGTVSIDPSQDFTQFDHTSGSASYAYKACYYASVLDQSSADSDWITPSGLQLYSQGNIRQRVKDKLTVDTYITDSMINDWINEWLERMTNAAIDVNEDYAIGTANIAFSGTAQEGTITSEDFKQVRRAWYTEDGVDVYQMTKQEMIGFSPSEMFNSTHPYYYMKGDNIIGRNPHDSSGTIQLSYYKLNPVLDSDADLLPNSMRGYSNSFVQWALSQAYRKDHKIKEATELESQCEAALFRFTKELTPRNKTGPTYIDLVEDTGESDLDIFW